MQFHMEGFRPGDPLIKPATEEAGNAPGAALPDTVDVLIIGSGPAGLTLAAQLSTFADINVRIVDQMESPLKLGKADGIACRTMEMFNAFGFAERIMKEACWISETTFWKPAQDGKAGIERHGRIQDVEDGLSEFPHVVLNQARVHDYYLEYMRNSPRRLEVDYARKMLDLTIDENANDVPVTVRLERTDAAHAGQIETVRARYVVGCDGARSAVRQSIGRNLKGDALNQAWGVMDILAVTDFPDVRMKSVIQSAEGGTSVIIPREGGYLFRMYVEMDELAEDERVASRNLTVDKLIESAKRILHPYTLDVKEVAWWSVYEIGHRITDKFDDVPDSEVGARLPRVFIAGDACHTHSPKAGQGMNVSMQDTFNLGWKLAHVLQGKAMPELLHSYSAERQAIAQDLIDFDRNWAAMLSAPLRSAENPNGVDPAEVQKHFVQSGRYTAGTATVYSPSVLTGENTHQPLASGFKIGTRFHSAPVIRLSDAMPMQLGHVFEADGRWRLLAFAASGDDGSAGGPIQRLCEWLSEAPNSPLVRYTPKDGDPDTVIDLRAVFQQGFGDLTIPAMPALLRPEKGRYPLEDWEKVFCSDLKSGKDIYDMRGIDRAKGCIVVVRPDQYIGHVLPLDGFEALAAYFDGFMTPQR
ncbi:FAD-binding monooxygenase [Rhizobium sp. L1K21]|uniref:FAD-binding monooxygenase n=1 Tax=Rhizobium sp. L1K21 TaxID=2954933 RepID=UPI002093C281|nr:FAD-binding monooxygenase [Rhizobium sp. L1K21]MCO6186595.1 FAD-binding monooxygenase [Rhizobium sp. L1K21]